MGKRGGGGDFSADSKGMHFLWTRSSSSFFDFSFKYRWHERKMGADEWARLLMVVCPNLKDDSRVLAVGATLAGTSGKVTESLVRSVEGETLFAGGESVSAPGPEGWIRLVRINNVFRFYFKESEEETWKKLRENYVDSDGVFSGDILVGPAISATGDACHAFTLTDISLGSPQEGLIILLK